MLFRIVCGEVLGSVREVEVGEGGFAMSIAKRVSAAVPSQIVFFVNV